ncbi:MAG TPA: DUF6491 family protein [Pseudomonadales bacterium]
MTFRWMPGTLHLVALTLLLGGCAAAERERRDEAARQETLEQILSEPLDADEYGTARRCISSIAYQDFEALGDRHVLFKGPGGKLWLNELRGQCPGLRHAQALAFESDSHQLCDLDRFVITDLFHWPRYRRWPWRWMDGIPCTLGRFQPVSPGQVQALREALKP